MFVCVNAKFKGVDFRKIIIFQDILAQPPPQGASYKQNKVTQKVIGKYSTLENCLLKSEFWAASDARRAAAAGG